MIPGFFEDVQMFLQDRQETHSYAFQMDWINVLLLIMYEWEKDIYPEPNNGTP